MDPFLWRDWLRRLGRRPRRQRPAYRPRVDGLEERVVLSPVNAGGNVALSAVEGQPFSIPTAAAFFDFQFPFAFGGTAVIEWGDQTPPSTVAVSGFEVFFVSASHTYGDEGNYPVLITFADAYGSAFATGTANVADADTGLAAASPQPAATVKEGDATTTFPVAVFANPGYPNNSPAEFQASINWGDGAATATPGSVTTAGDGNFTVLGSHAYADEATHTVLVTLTEGAEPGAPPPVTATATNSVTVTDADTLTGVPGGTTHVSEGPAGTAAFPFRFQDTYAPAQGTDFTATIDWGDGASGLPDQSFVLFNQIGTSDSGGNHYLTFSGSHTYADEGTYTATATITEDSSTVAAASAAITVIVGESDTLTAAPSQPSVTLNEGDGISPRTVGVFAVSGYPGNPAPDFAASIAWGDGLTTAGTVAGSKGTFTVSGTHAYAEEGTFPVTVVLRDGTEAGVGAAATATTTSTVLEGEGRPFDDALAVFTSADTHTPTATIAWGDNTQTPATVTTAGDGSYTVTGSHTYLDEGTYTLGYAFTDDTGTRTQTQAVTIVDADGPILVTAGPLDPQPTEAKLFSGTVATFTTFNPGSLGGDFTATIDWGDGTPGSPSTATGTIGGAGGSFTVTGSHTYAGEGFFLVRVTVLDDGTTVTGQDTAHVVVTEGDLLTSPPATAGPQVTEGPGGAGAVYVFRLNDVTNPTGRAEDFTASIDWGDNTPATPLPAGGIQAQPDVVGGVTVSTFLTASVTGLHTYADEGTYTATATFAEADDSNVTGTAALVVVVVEGDTLTPAATQAPVTLAEQDGVTPAAVAVFSVHGVPGNPPSDFLATIDWGDGTSAKPDVTIGTVTGSGGTFTVLGTHAYASPGVFPLTVVLEDGNEAGTAQQAVATATNAATVLATEGRPFVLPGVVFTSTATSTPTASIDWGDGPSGQADVTPATLTGGPGTVTAGGSHVYADEGTYTLTVLFTDGSGAATTATRSAVIAEADTLVGVSAAASATEGPAGGTFLFQFSDTYAGALAADFTATIDWGDGTPGHPDLVTIPAGQLGTSDGGGIHYLTVSATHAYQDEGVFAAVATLREDGASTSSAVAIQTISVGEADTPAAATAQPALTFTAANGTTSLTLAVFTDLGYPTNTASDFTATINWGDGTPTNPDVSAGSVSAAGAGTLAVSGSHAYAAAGTFPVTVVLTDDHEAGNAMPAAATVTTTATVLPVEGLPFTAAAVFTATPSGTPAGSIDWGDGPPGRPDLTPAPVTGGAGTYTISASHVYADEGTYALRFFLTDATAATLTASQSAAVGDADTLTGVPGVPHAVPEGPLGAAFPYVLLFQDANAAARAADFMATIDWGDGPAGQPDVVALPPAQIGTTDTGSSHFLTVTGFHQYRDEGTYTVTASIAEDEGSTVSATTTGVVVITEADVLAAATVQPRVAVTEGDGSTSVPVAYFTDPGYPNNTPSDFQAFINWGDQATHDIGTVSGSNGLFTVSGAHAYADEGTYPVSVLLLDDGASAVAGTTATALEGDQLSVKGLTINPTEAVAFTGVPVATFTSSFAGNPAGDFSAEILWGDGSSSAGTLGGAAGLYTVSGSHTYAEEGTYSTTVRVRDDAPGTAVASGAGTALVQDLDTLTATAVSFAATEGRAVAGVPVATFTDPTNPANTADDFTALVVWGDGSSSAGTVQGSAGQFRVLGSHLYADEGSYAVGVVVRDDSPGASSASASVTVTVAEGDVLMGQGLSLTATEARVFSGAVAAFTNTGYPGNPANDFSALIDWGDGNTSAGTVAGSGGTLTVSGSHLYLEETSTTVKVTLAEDGPAPLTATASSPMQVLDASLTPMAATFAATENTSFSGAVATFGDADPNGVASDYSATIDWGDNTPASAASLSGDINNGFTVSGTHIYADDGTYPVRISLTDHGPTLTVTSTAAVSGLPITGLVGVPVNGFELGPLAANLTVANFAHGNNQEAAGAFSARVDWGDGTVTPGTVALTTGTASATPYAVQATHTYQDEGTYTVTVTVTDGAATAAAATSAAILEELPPPAIQALLPPGQQPRGDATDRFITEIYRDLFHRPVDVQGWQGARAALLAGMTFTNLVLALENSDEYRLDEVSALYQRYLNRPADPAADPGVAGMVTFLRTGGTVEQLAAIIVASPEFFRDSGGTNDGFLDNLYGLALGAGRTIDAPTRPVVDAMLQAGTLTRQQMAAVVFASDEYHRDVVKGIYLQFLERPVDPTGLAGWTMGLDMGLTDGDVIAMIVGTPGGEFFTKTAR